MSDELYHYGVLGMKWGVRRYQNPDGTLTNAGRNRLRKISEKTEINRTESHNQKRENWDELDAINRKRFGINQTKDPNTDILKKNSKIYRVANSGEPIDSKRKYVSITKGDRLSYKGMWEMLDLDWDKPISEYTYNNNKDLRIATGKAVTDHILDKYGKKTYRQLSEDLEFAKNIKLYEVGKDKKITRIVDEKDTRWLENFKTKGNDKIQKTIDKAMKNHLDEITNDFVKRGYDAIVDMEDASFLTDYPVIILDPSKNLTLKREKQMT